MKTQIVSASRLRTRIVQIVRQALDEIGLAGVAKGKVPSGYVSGNPTIQQAWESTAGSKTHKIVAPISNRNGALVASESIAYGFDPDGNRFVQGKLADVSGVIVDADYVMGLRPVAPGNTVRQSADTERNTNSASYVVLKEFIDSKPGKWRLSFELSRDGGAAKAIVKIRRPDGTYIDASAEATYSSTVYPTFGSFSLDMTTEAWWGCQIAVSVKNDSGPAQIAYIQNCKLKYSDATASLSPYSAVITD